MKAECILQPMPRSGAPAPLMDLAAKIWGAWLKDSLQPQGYNSHPTTPSKVRSTRKGGICLELLFSREVSAQGHTKPGRRKFQQGLQAASLVALAASLHLASEALSHLAIHCRDAEEKTLLPSGPHFPIFKIRSRHELLIFWVFCTQGGL